MDSTNGFLSLILMEHGVDTYYVSSEPAISNLLGVIQ